MVIANEICVDELLLYFSDFLDQDSTHAINVDAKVFNHVKLNLANPSYNTFDEAQVRNIFQ